MQSALQKERRELKQAQREEQSSVPVGLNKNWIDPLPEGIPVASVYIYTDVWGYRQTVTSARVILTKNVRPIRAQIVKKYKKYTIYTWGQPACCLYKYTL